MSNEEHGFDLELIIPKTLMESNSDHVGHMVGVINTLLDNVTSSSEEDPLLMYFLQSLAIQYLAKSSRRDIVHRLSPEQRELYEKLLQEVELQLLRTNVANHNKH